MHQVNPKHRRAAFLRVITYSLIIILSTLTTIVLLYVALGYRFDRTSGHVVRSGLLLVSNKPTAAEVYIDNQLKDTSAPSRFELTTGDYTLSLKRSGYRDWSKKISILPSTVEEVYYPLLIPNTLQPRTLLSVNNPVLVSQSHDRKFVLLQSDGEPQLQLLELDPKAPKQTTLTLPDQIKRENNQTGTFKVVEWALNNKQVLLSQTLPSGTTELISLDVTKPQEAINISDLYGSEVLGQPHYVGSDTSQIYALSNGTLKRYSLKENNSQLIMENVRNYQPYGNATVEFARTDSTQQNVESGLWQNGKAVVVHTTPIHPGGDLLAFASYNNKDYFVVGQTDGEEVTVYSNPLESPVLTKQLPFTTIAFHHPQKLSFSDSSEFLLAQNGNKAITYDFEHIKKYSYGAPFTLQPGSLFYWMDDSHLMVTKADGMNTIMDYDFTNAQDLVTSNTSNDLFFADDYKYLYRLLTSEDKVNLETASLVVGLN